MPHDVDSDDEIVVPEYIDGFKDGAANQGSTYEIVAPKGDYDGSDTTQRAGFVVPGLAASWQDRFAYLDPRSSSGRGHLARLAVYAAAAAALVWAAGEMLAAPGDDDGGDGGAIAVPSCDGFRDPLPLTQPDGKLRAYRGATPTLDGVISPEEWCDAELWKPGMEQLRSQYSAVTDPLDLSVQGWLKHDAEALFFAFDVADDTMYGGVAGDVRGDTGTRYRPKGYDRSGASSALCVVFVTNPN